MKKSDEWDRILSKKDMNEEDLIGITIEDKDNIVDDMRDLENEISDLESQVKESNESSYEEELSQKLAKQFQTTEYDCLERLIGATQVLPNVQKIEFLMDNIDKINLTDLEKLV